MWWLPPLSVIIGLGLFIIYALWAALQNADYYSAPYISPFYAPCLAATCEHPALPLVGPWWKLTPALLTIWIPLGFRTTCYYFRKAYYRSFFGSPPNCAVRDLPRRYAGETRFPFVLQNIHRYFFWLSFVLVFLHWADVIAAFRFAGGFGMGLGTLVMIVDATLLSLYVFSCHSCRFLTGGYLDVFSSAPIRYRLWSIVSRLNANHMLFAWTSLFFVGFADLYVRLLSMGVITDVRFF